LIKSTLIGSTLCVLFAVSVISYAGTFTQNDLRQGLQGQAQSLGKAESVDSLKDHPSKPEDPKLSEGGVATKVETGLAFASNKALVSPSGAAKANTVVGFAETYVATAYSLRGRTASGRPVSRGLIAADPSVLPLGTRVRLEAGTFSGEYVVADTGGAVRGHHVDIWTPTAGEAMRFGKRAIKLTVLSYGARRGRSALKRGGSDKGPMK
jgi:3D (Asp-Asp-Asp) domain-containing protein